MSWNPLNTGMPRTVSEMVEYERFDAEQRRQATPSPTYYGEGIGLGGVWKVIKWITILSVISKLFE